MNRNLKCIAKKHKKSYDISGLAMCTFIFNAELCVSDRERISAKLNKIFAKEVYMHDNSKRKS